MWDLERGWRSRAPGARTSVSFSPDGERLAIAAFDSTVRVWDPDTRQEIRTLKGHTAGVAVSAFSPDGKRPASGSCDRTVRVWDAETGQVVAAPSRAHPDRRVL